MKKFFLPLIILCTFASYSYSQVSQEDFEALVAIYNATGGDNWKDNANWNINGTAADVTSDWYGVTVDGGRVTEIDLRSNNLIGTIPSEIGQLTAIEDLRFNDNKLTSIPSEIGDLPVLNRFWVGNNLLTEVPAELGNLTELISLDLSHNALTEIPAEIGNLSLLTNLNLEINNLTSIPPELGNLSSLASIYLNGNKLTSIPKEIGNWSNLVYLLLNNNQLTTIPAEIGNLTSLEGLRLNNNNLTSLPPEIGELSSLIALYLNSNALANLPGEITNLSNLNRLHVFDNELDSLFDLSGLTELNDIEVQNNYLDFEDLSNSNVPWKSITATYSPQALVHLSSEASNGTITISCNSEFSNSQYKWFRNRTEMSGKTSSSIAIDNTDSAFFYCEVTNPDYPKLKLTSRSIWFNVNPGVTTSDLEALIRFYEETGGPNWSNNTNWLSDKPVGEWYGINVGNGRVTEIYFNNNNLSGGIPNVIGDLTGLTRLLLMNIGVSTVPAEIGNLKALNNLTIWGRNLSDLPSSFSELKALKSLDLANNQFKTWPSSIFQLTGLTYLNLETNYLKNVPGEIEQLEHLSTLVLGNNSFVDFPTEVINLPSLRILNITKNQLNFLPAEIGNFSKLEVLSLDDNHLTNIPSEIGEIDSLRILYLTKNEITNLPSEITALSKLSELRLSANRLSSLFDFSSLSNLSALFLDYNQLDFGDLEDLNLSFISSYHKQSKVSLGRTETNGKVTLTSYAGGTNNQYKWYKNDALMDNETAQSITVDQTESAIYYCEITNPDYPQLTLNSLSEGVNLVNGVLKDDYNALVAIYEATDGPNWRGSTNWLSEEAVDNWYGVFVEEGRVKEINLSYTGLKGCLPPEIGNLKGLKTLKFVSNQLTCLPNEIGELSELTYLNLSYNELTSIPPEIGKLTKLHDLYLDHNKLQDLPIEIGGLSSLFRCDINDNELVSLPSEMGNLTNLYHLELGFNQLFNLPSSFSNMTGLYFLTLNNNKFTIIPTELLNMTWIDRVDLSNNELEELADMSGLTNLSFLYIDNNKLDFGDLEVVNVDPENLYVYEYSPQSNVQLIKTTENDLIKLSVPNNGTKSSYEWFKDGVKIEGEKSHSFIPTTSDPSIYKCIITNSDFPDLVLTSEEIYLPAGISKGEYDALVALYEATDGENWTNSTNWLTNVPVDDWFGVDVFNNHVYMINLEDNNLTGTIPKEIGNLEHLTMLGLSSGHLTGSIPYQISNCKKLTHLGLSGNSLKGSVPYGVRNLTYLQNLILFGNELIGIPDLSSLKYMSIISVADNKFTFEDIEPNLGVASMDFNYAPQATVGNKSWHKELIGTIDTLVMRVGGTNNVYQWYKDGAPIADSNNDTLIVSDIVMDDAGEYYCEITNTLATDLTLKSDTITLIIVYPVTISVSDKTGAVQNAGVVLDELDTVYTDAQGQVSIKNVESIVEHRYTITAPNHSNYTSTFTISSVDDTQIDVNLLITSFEQKNSHQTKIYPNPSTGQFIIQLGKQPTDYCHVDIIDLTGHKVFTQQLRDLRNELSMDANLRGTYILRIVEDGLAVDIQKVVFVE